MKSGVQLLKKERGNVAVFIPFECNEERSATNTPFNNSSGEAMFECNEERSATLCRQSLSMVALACLNAMKSGVQQIEILQDGVHCHDWFECNEERSAKQLSSA